jgi:hypothetical protein
MPKIKHTVSHIERFVEELQSVCDAHWRAQLPETGSLGKRALGEMFQIYEKHRTMKDGNVTDRGKLNDVYAIIMHLQTEADKASEYNVKEWCEEALSAWKNYKSFLVSLMTTPKSENMAAKIWHIADKEQNAFWSVYWQWRIQAEDDPSPTIWPVINKLHLYVIPHMTIQEDVCRFNAYRCMRGEKMKQKITQALDSILSDTAHIASAAEMHHKELRHDHLLNLSGEMRRLHM